MAATSPTASPNATPGPGAKGLSTGAKAGIGVAVAAVVVVAVILSGAIPGIHPLASSSSSSSSSGSPQSSTGALKLANPEAKAHDSGTLLIAIGVAPTFSFSFGKEEATNASCPLSDALTANFTVPTQSDYSSGDAALWLFVYYNASVPSESILAVVGSTTYFLGIESGADCVTETTLPTIPADSINSTTAAATANADAGSFLADNAHANGLFVLIGSTTDGSEWGIIYTNCSYDPTTETFLGGTHGNIYEAAIDGTTKAVLSYGGGEGLANCTSLTSDIGSKSYALALSEVSDTGSGTSWQIYLAIAATGGLTTSMFGMTIDTSGGTAVAPASTVPAGCDYDADPSACTGESSGWYGVLVSEATGWVVATYDADGWGNLAPATTNVSMTSGLELIIVSYSLIAGNGDTLSVFATGSASVSGSVSL